MNEQEKRAKVIKGLECCVNDLGECEVCPYDEGMGKLACGKNLYSDALALLKAQEALTCGECKHYDTHAFTDYGGKCRNSLSNHYCYGCDKTFGCNAWEGR